MREGVGRGVRRPPVRLRAASTASLESGHLVFCKRRFPFGDVPDPRLRWGRSGTVETELLFDHVPATYTMILVLNGIFVFHLKQSFFLNINEEVITTIHMLYSIYNYPSALSDCSCVFFLLFLKDLGEKEGRLNHFFYTAILLTQEVIAMSDSLSYLYPTPCPQNILSALVRV